jgi:hypothetical protein
MLYCYASKKAGDRVNGDTEFRLITKRKKGLIYDLKQDVFRWTHDGTIVKLADLNDDIMPFSEGIEMLITKFDIDTLMTFPPTTDFNDSKQRNEAEKLIKRVLESYRRNRILGHINFTKIIERHGGKCVMSSNDEKIIECWPNYYKTRRKTKVLTGKELITMLPEELASYTGNGMVFVKTARKNFAEYISPREILDPLGIFYQLVVDSALDLNFIISEPAAIKKIELTLPYSTVSSVKEDDKKDNHKGCRYINAEYRCIVIKGELQNISLYTDSLIHTVPEEAYNFAIQVMNKMEKTVSSLQTYNFDIMQFDDGTWDVIEFHTVPALGCYLYNTLYVDLERDAIVDSNLRDNCLHTDLAKLPLRIIKDISSGKRKVVEITEYLDAKYDNSGEDRGYASPYSSMKKHGLAMAYMLLRMVDTGIMPGLESVNPETRKETKKNIVGFMGCMGVDKTEIEKLVDSQEERLQLRFDDPQQILERARAEEARLKSRYDGIIGLEASDAWYVKEAIERDLLQEQTSENTLKLHKKPLI